MEYRKFGNTGMMLSALGFGMNRFSPVLLSEDGEGGITQAVALVEKAVLEYGVNYIDVAHTYSGGYAYKIISQLSVPTKKIAHFSIKTSMSCGDYTAGDAYRRVTDSLAAMDLSRAEFGFVWAIRSMEEYHSAIASGGIYEGLERAKKEGLISHICVSLHASPKECIEIIRGGLFEGVTLSVHPLNFELMEPVLDIALSEKIGVFIMNPFAGGMILQYPQIMPQLPVGYSVAQASIAKLLSHPAVTCCLSGMNNSTQLVENVNTFRLLQELTAISYEKAGQILCANFCTGCGYCVDCPQRIPIPTLMQGYNSYLIGSFSPKYGVVDSDRLADIYAFETVKRGLSDIPKDAANPCVRCGLCEAKCTQKLPIVHRLAKMYKKMDCCGFSLSAWEKRLFDLLGNCAGQSVYFYPAGLYTRNVIHLYYRLFGEPDFDLHIFDRNPMLTGTELYDGYLVEPASEMKDADGLLCLITNFAHEDEIYQELTTKLRRTKVVRLHSSEDVPWLYLYW